MKNTFLINKPQKDGTTALCTATAEEWIAVANGNRNLPTEQRRYFIADCIEEGKDIDRMIIEVPYAEYRRWNSCHTMTERSRKAGKKYQHLSLDAALNTPPYSPFSRMRSTKETRSSTRPILRTVSAKRSKSITVKDRNIMWRTIIPLSSTLESSAESKRNSSGAPVKERLSRSEQKRSKANTRASMR